ncbi:MAG TPA: hypothetical protein VHE13_17885 [Opitutus sp.]|nr:hypothetical protein [Opitutus sp.]
MRLRRLPAFSLFVCFVSFVVSLARAADVHFVRVWPGWRDAASFDRISEYFTEQEDTGSRVVQRTHPSVRDGFYFLVRVANSDAALAGAKFSLQLVAPTSPQTKTYTFPADVPAHSTVFMLGLTGPDWPNRKAHPVAWKLDLLAADGRVVATEHSFLWEKPPGQ